MRSARRVGTVTRSRARKTTVRSVPVRTTESASRCSTETSSVSTAKRDIQVGNSTQCIVFFSKGESCFLLLFVYIQLKKEELKGLVHGKRNVIRVASQAN